MKRLIWLMILTIGLFDNTIILHARNYTQRSKLVPSNNYTLNLYR